MPDSLSGSALGHGRLRPWLCSSSFSASSGCSQPSRFFTAVSWLPTAADSLPGSRMSPATTASSLHLYPEGLCLAAPRHRAPGAASTPDLHPVPGLAPSSLAAPVRVVPAPALPLGSSWPCHFGVAPSALLPATNTTGSLLPLGRLRLLEVHPLTPREPVAPKHPSPTPRKLHLELGSLLGSGQPNSTSALAPATSASAPSSPSTASDFWATQRPLDALGSISRVHPLFPGSSTFDLAFGSWSTTVSSRLLVISVSMALGFQSFGSFRLGPSAEILLKLPSSPSAGPISCLHPKSTDDSVSPPDTFARLPSASEGLHPQLPSPSSPPVRLGPNTATLRLLPSSSRSSRAPPRTPPVAPKLRHLFSLLSTVHRQEAKRLRC